MEQPENAGVQAAGGIVYRRGSGGPTEIAAVHRSPGDEWSLPRGRVPEGGTPEQTALREVEAETGFRCLIVRPAGTARYPSRAGRDEIVAYWVMRSLGGHFQSGHDIDQLRWVTVKEAMELLSHEADRTLVAAQLGSWL